MNKKNKTNKKQKFPGDLSELVHFLGKKFDATDKRFDNLESMFRNLQGSVDAYAKKADTYFQEMAMLSHKVNRLEKWILQIAKEAGIHLKA